jgi:hypothetical protein
MSIKVGQNKQDNQADPYAPMQSHHRSFISTRYSNCLLVVVYYDPLGLQILHYQEGCQ